MASKRQRISETESSKVADREYKSQFCEICWRAFDIGQFRRAYDCWFRHDDEYRKTNEPPGFKHVDTWQSLCYRSESGCRLCSLLRNQILSSKRMCRHQKFNVFITISPGVADEVPFGLNTIQIKIICTNCQLHANSVQNRLGKSFETLHAQEQAELLRTRILLTTDDDSHFAATITGRPLCHILNGSMIQQETRRWLQACKAHVSCGLQQGTELPSRVIDVETPNRPRIINSKGIFGQYVAMSYCWGGPQSGVLNTTNIGQYSRCIDIERISATARDAIHTTKRIGFRYLWIDALCILQDDEDDKTKEIAKMVDVYKNALLTLVISSSHSAKEGFLHDRDSQESIAYLQLQASDGAVAKISLHPDRLIPYLSGEPLQKRAWAFQEWILSSRRLVFAADTLKWHCQELSENAGRSFRDQSWWTYALRHQNLLNRTTDLERIHYWTRLVRDFSGRKLTLPQDKLPAIDGLARTLSTQWRYKYLVGFLERHFIHQLLWHAESRSSLPKIYRAPSWSWASVDGLIRFWFFSAFRDIAASQTECTLLRYYADSNISDGRPRFCIPLVLTILAKKTEFAKLEHQYSRKKEQPVTMWKGFDDGTPENGPVPSDAAVAVLISHSDEFWGLLLVPVQNHRWRRIGFAKGDLNMVAHLTPEVIRLI